VEIAASHILISYKGALHAAPYIDRTKEEALAFAEELLEKAKAGENFEELAREHSDDRGSAATGGSLGKFRREQMVPEFSNAAFGLEVGGFSQVVESQYGFHVIRRDE
jgi:peptidyl-prolyl cis-trans isomerase C